MSYSFPCLIWWVHTRLLAILRTLQSTWVPFEIDIFFLEGSSYRKSHGLLSFAAFRPFLKCPPDKDLPSLSHLKYRLPSFFIPHSILTFQHSTLFIILLKFGSYTILFWFQRYKTVIQQLPIYFNSSPSLLWLLSINIALYIITANNILCAHFSCGSFPLHDNFFVHQCQNQFQLSKTLCHFHIYKLESFHISWSSGCHMALINTITTSW